MIIARIAEELGLPEETVRSSLSKATAMPLNESRHHCSASTTSPSQLSTSEAPLSVALLLSGNYDIHGHFGMPPSFVDLFRDNLVQGVLRINPRNHVHTFICAGGPQTIFTYRGRPFNATQPDWSSLRGPRSMLTEVDTSAAVTSFPGAKVRGADPQYERIEACYLAARRHRRQHSVQHSDRSRDFTHFIRARFDLAMYAPLPASAFDDEKVSLRARALAFADECERVHYQAFTAVAWKTCGWDHPSAALTPSADLQKDGSSLGVPAWYARHWALQLAGRGARFCYAADDMFAVVPAHVADAFFLRPGVLEEHSTLPLGWDPNRSLRSRAASADVYGPVLDGAHYRRFCGYLPFANGAEACAYTGPTSPSRCPLLTRGVCDYRNASSPRRAPTANATLCAHNGDTFGARVEFRLTARLHTRLVPVQFVPLTYSAALLGTAHRKECSRETVALLTVELARLERDPSGRSLQSSASTQALRAQLKNCRTQSQQQHC